jgi:hypothetical protein
MLAIIAKDCPASVRVLALKGILIFFGKNRDMGDWFAMCGFIGVGGVSNREARPRRVGQGASELREGARGVGESNDSSWCTVYSGACPIRNKLATFEVEKKSPQLVGGCHGYAGSHASLLICGA